MVAVDAAKRMSQAMASSQPPPRATPLIAAMVGTGAAAISSASALMARLWRYFSSFDIALRCLRSAPAQKPGPLAASTSTRAPDSPSVATAARSASISSTLSAL